MFRSLNSPEHLSDHSTYTWLVFHGRVLVLTTATFYLQRVS